ncbi:3D domain-containing protein [Robiginitalea sp. IMCC43444]|uniref:3D domain-containing protein n=1 Tax=Robiginitalea sp. IMCC43444 TaxID=3459121 RepID=UPI0040418E09
MRAFYFNIVLSLTAGLLLVSCGKKGEALVWHEMEVTATAYNSVRWQTSDDPSIAAWGDTLIPGMKCIAVSRDLLKLGLARDTPVKISGMDGTYLVKDKMNARFKKHIDIYMGMDIQKAREWGRKKVTISYGLKPQISETE